MGNWKSCYYTDDWWRPRSGRIFVVDIFPIFRIIPIVFNAFQAFKSTKKLPFRVPSKLKLWLQFKWVFGKLKSSYYNTSGYYRVNQATVPGKLKIRLLYQETKILYQVNWKPVYYTRKISLPYQENQSIVSGKLKIILLYQRFLAICLVVWHDFQFPMP